MLGYELELLLDEEYEALLGVEFVKDGGVFLVEKIDIELALVLTKKEVVLLDLGFDNNDKKWTGFEVGWLFGDKDGTLLGDIDVIEIISLFGVIEGSKIGLQGGAEDWELSGIEFVWSLV